MRLLMITLEPPLAPDAVATGNAIRTRQLESAFLHAGHTVRQVWQDRKNTTHPDAFHNRDKLQATIIRQRPDAIVVAFWELLALLPFNLQQPVIVDFVAPRPLEVLYENPELVGAELQRLQSNLSKCDLILTGNGAQRDLLWFTLLQAGFDLRGNEPILVVPLAAEPAGVPKSDPEVNGWTLVSGGVSWPWRESDEYWRAIQAMKEESAAESLRLVLFGGQYRWHEGEPKKDGAKYESFTRHQPLQGGSGHQTQTLAPYSHFSQFLLDSAHIGLEVAQPNIERKYSQSFRSLEFLRHGLPLICNDYLPISDLVKQYKAGWTINNPDEMTELLSHIMTRPEEWKIRSTNAGKLITEVLNPVAVAKPLLDWLESPVKATRLPVLQQPAAEVVLGTPPLSQRLIRQARMLRTVGLRRIFRSPPGENVLIVTRSDLFPDDHGAAVKIVETARALSQHGRKVGIVSDDRKYWWLFENGHKQRCRLPLWLRLFSLPRSLTRLMHMSKNLPESNAFLYLPLSDSSFFWHCLYVGRKLNAGVLQAEFPAYAKPCIEAREILKAPVVMVEHNVEYSRLKAQVAELSEEQFQNLKAIELDLCNRSDAVICVSDNDRQQLLNDGVKPELLNTIPHGFNPISYALPAKDGLRERYGLPGNAVLMAFHGTFSYPPNIDAIQVFAKILLPQLADANNPFHVIAIGRGSPSESPHPNIHFTGSVEEVGPWLKACDLAVIPLREGGGTRMKIIDCFAAGLPVISTSKGIEGIPVVNQQEAIIIDDWSKMINEIIGLSKSGERRAQLSTAALEFAEKMDWESITKRYLSIFSTLRQAAR